jgi:hypothetical protein
MLALFVEVQATLADDQLKVAPVDDQHPVEACSAAAPDPVLCKRICPQCHQRRKDHSSTARVEDPIGLRRTLLIPIVDQRR